MYALSTFLLLLLASTLTFGQTAEQQRLIAELKTLQFQRGPAEGAVGLEAKMSVPPGHFFLNSGDTAKFLKLLGNPPQPNHFAFGPDDFSWFAVFHFTDAGYVKDDEKIDANALLTALKESDAPANEERRRLGMEPIHTDGWLVPPHYDMATKRLEWGLRLHSDSGEQIINYTSRLLGRSGYMSATLVSSPEEVGKDMEIFRRQLAGFAFVPGQTYAEYRSGDKVAEYGLGALVVGGAAAAAAKSGFFKSLGKLIWVGILAVLGFLGAIWKKITGRKTE